MKLKLIIVFVFFSVLTFAQTKMNTSEITSFKKEVINEVKNLKTYSADFTETKHLSFLKNPTISSGKMYMKSPNKVLWQYVKPETTTILFSDQKIILKKAGKSKSTDLTRNKQFGKLNDLVLNSFNGKLFDAKDFTANYFKASKQRIVKLYPTDKQLKKYIKEVVLTFDDGSHMVSEVKMIQPSNDYTLIKFSNRKTNPKLDESLFK